MGKPRVRGNHATIHVVKSDGDLINIGEVSKFSVKELGEIKKSRAIGQNSVTSNKTFEGYDLSFEGGKVDWNLAQVLHRQDQQIYQGRRSPLFKVIQKVFFYDGSVQEFTYEDVTIYGYNLDIDANDELMEKFEGFCGTLRTALHAGQAEADNTSNKSVIDILLTQSLAKDTIINDTSRAIRTNQSLRD